MKDTDIIRQLVDEVVWDGKRVEEAERIVESINYHLDMIDQEMEGVQEELRIREEEGEILFNGEAEAHCLSGPRISKGPLAKTSHKD